MTPKKTSSSSISNLITIAETPAIKKAKSFLEIFYHREKLHPDKIFLRQPSGSTWTEYSWAQVGEQARKMLTVLNDLGLEKGDHIGILSKNCAHWIVADLAILMGGFISVPFYPTLPHDELKQVIEMSDIKALFVGKLETWEQQQEAIPEEIHCIAFPHHEGNSKVTCSLQWDKIMKDYAPAIDVHHPKKDELFTIIFTSGTTGTPKGVMLTYNCANQVTLTERKHPVYGIYQGVSERVISYLPLNHIAERVVSEICSIVAGSEVSFSESLTQFSTNLQSVKPTLFFAVPRIWVKIQQGILAKIPQKKLNILLSLPVASSLLKAKIRKGLGLSEVKAAISGAAPVSSELLTWFNKIGINIQEVYGATELCGGVTFNAGLNKTNDASGTVGQAIAGSQIKIDKETDEILIKSSWTMTGYYKSPKKTAEVFEGKYYKTGDTGKLDAHGNLIITGRIKDTFKTAKGKFVLPVPIEHKFSINPLIEQVVVTGIGLVQPIALINLSENADIGNKEHMRSIECTLEDINKTSSNHEKISTLVVFKESWADDSGFFTPTLKLKRHIIDETFKHNYETWQESKELIIIV